MASSWQEMDDPYRRATGHIDEMQRLIAEMREDIDACQRYLRLALWATFAASVLAAVILVVLAVRLS